MRLSIVTLGHVHAEDLQPLTTRFTHLEQLVLDIHPRGALTEHRAELNRAVDAAGTDWVLIIREREVVDDALADEIAAAVKGEKAWGYRIQSVPIYAGKPLRIGPREGELRLFHRRHFLRRGELAVQGTVVRFGNPLRSITFATPEEHRAHLARTGAPRSPLRHALLFLGYLAGIRVLDANTLRYLWIEAGFDAPRQ